MYDSAESQSDCNFQESENCDQKSIQKTSDVLLPLGGIPEAGLHPFKWRKKRQNIILTKLV